MRRSSRRIAESQKKVQSETAKEKHPKHGSKPEIIEISSDSDKADSDYAQYLETYTEETSTRSLTTSEEESQTTVESKFERTKSPEPEPMARSPKSEYGST